MTVNFLLKPWEQQQQHPLSYPDMSHLHQAENLLASPPDHLFTPHKHLANHPRHGQTLTVHAGKVKTTFGINDFVQTALVAT